MRIGLGCMRLSTEAGRNEDSALATLGSAFDAGFGLFDTAHAYGLDEADVGHNERLIERAWRARDAQPRARVVTKCGMGRDGGNWVPDGRAKRIQKDAEASVAALGSVPIDLLLLHTPDPSVPIATSARALVRARDDGLARAVGVCNVTRKQLEEACAHAPIAAVEVALSAFDDEAIRSGVVGYCLERGIEVLAHSPLGGPQRAARLGRDPLLARIADRLGVGAGEVFLAYLLAVRPEIVPIVGARRAATVARIVVADRLALEEGDLAALDARFPNLGSLRRPAVRITRDAEVVMIMGVPGAGKSRAAEAYVARGYERLNRDTLGGTLRGIAQRLDERLAAGAGRVVLDNTYVTRASRHDVVRIATTRGAAVRCVWLETPLAEAEVNVIARMLDRFGRLLGPEELAELARATPPAIAPHALFRTARDLEPPAADEGFAAIERVPFVREHAPGGVVGTVVALGAFEETGGGYDIAAALAQAPQGAPCLLLAWTPLATSEWAAAMHRSVALAAHAGCDVELALCAHPAGRPICWCRPPLPGLSLAFARRRNVDLCASTFVGASATDRKMAESLGMRWRDIGTKDAPPNERP
jgi:aryl-alcohol dehydrogenase-like predicted oxidoreductase